MRVAPKLDQSGFGRNRKQRAAASGQHELLQSDRVAERSLSNWFLIGHSSFERVAMHRLTCLWAECFVFELARVSSGVWLAGQLAEAANGLRRQLGERRAD